ncbi:hypothetical protein VaNZ11_005943, partial [Volvox africanus]
KTMPLSSRVRELNIWTFQGSVGDSRLWFVKFYVPWCRGCKRMTGQYDELAEAFESKPEIVIARFDCMQNEKLCERLGVDRTPTLKLFFNGAVVETYKADFYHVELMGPFLRKMLEKYKGVTKSKTQDMDAGTAAAGGVSVRGAGKAQDETAAAHLEGGNNSSVETSPKAAPGPAGSAGTAGLRYGRVEVQPDDVIRATPLEAGVYDRPAGATPFIYGEDSDGEGGGTKEHSDNQLDVRTASRKWVSPERAEDAVLTEVASAVAADLPDGGGGDGGDGGGG